MKVVVAGGTGFVGRYVTRALLDAGHAVTVLGRRGRTDGIPQLEGADAVAGDVTKRETLAGTLEGADAVVGAVAFPNYPAELPRKGLTFDRYDRLGTENLLDAARAAGVSRYVYISGAGADPTSPKTWYRAKGRAEEALRAADLSHAIVRPSWAYGPEDKSLNKFVAMARFSPVIPRLGLQPQRIQPVHVAEIGTTVARVFERDAWDATFEIGGPDIMTMDAVIRTMLKLLDKKRMIVPVPLVLPKLATAPLVLLPRPPMTPGGIEFAAQSGIVDTTALERDLDVHPVPLEEGLRTYLGAA